jgi:hypothetical protein
LSGEMNIQDPKKLMGHLINILNISHGAEIRNHKHVGGLSY